MPPRHLPSHLTYPTESSVKYFYAGRWQICHFEPHQIDAEVEAVLDEDPSISDVGLGAIHIRQSAIVRLLFQELEAEQDPSTDRSSESAEAAYAEILVPVGTAVHILATGEEGVVLDTEMDRGVRVYTVKTATHVLPGCLYKELQAP